MTEVAEYKNTCAPNELIQVIGTVEELDIIAGEIVLRKH